MLAPFSSALRLFFIGKIIELITVIEEEVEWVIG